MIAVNQVLTSKVTQGTVSDEAVADPEIPFSNTLDELLEDSMTEFEAEDLLLGELEEGQLMAEQELGEEAILVEENILETLTDDENQIALAVPMAMVDMVMVPNSRNGLMAWIAMIGQRGVRTWRWDSGWP